MMGSLLKQMVSGMGTIPEGDITGSSGAEESHWWTRTPTSGYCEDATGHYILAARLYMH